MALNRINLNFLTHVAGDLGVLCTAAQSGEAAFTLLRAQAGTEGDVHFQPGSAIISIYPHDKRPGGYRQFHPQPGPGKVIIDGLASSPSPFRRNLVPKEKVVVRQLFQDFHFPASSRRRTFLRPRVHPRNWCPGGGRITRKRSSSLLDRPPSDLDLWGMAVSSTDILAGFADVLLELGKLGLAALLSWWPSRREAARVPPVFQPRRTPPPGRVRGVKVRRILQKHLPDLRPMRLTPVAGIFLHGPHFGDRYGIAQVLVESLEKAHVSLLALSCTISSISLVIRAAPTSRGRSWSWEFLCFPWWRRSGGRLLGAAREAKAWGKVPAAPEVLSGWPAPLCCWPRHNGPLLLEFPDPC